MKEITSHFDKKAATLEAKLDKIKSLLSSLEEKFVFNDRYESENTDQINEALAKSQSEYPKIILNRKEEQLNRAYTDLDNIMNKIRPILGKNGISVTQRTKLTDEGKVTLQTRIWHSSGQWIESREKVAITDNDFDLYNSMLNEIKKIQIMCILNITIANDEFDDNAYFAMKDYYNNPDFNNYDPKKQSFNTITSKQTDTLLTLCSYVPGMENKILKTYKIKSISDLPKNQYESVKQVITNNVDYIKGIK